MFTSGMRGCSSTVISYSFVLGYSFTFMSLISTFLFGDTSFTILITSELTTSFVISYLFGYFLSSNLGSFIFSSGFGLITPWTAMMSVFLFWISSTCFSTYFYNFVVSFIFWFNYGWFVIKTFHSFTKRWPVSSLSNTYLTVCVLYLNRT